VIEMRIVEILSIALVAAGIAMHFTAAFGVGDHQTANSMISAGIGLLGGYAYGRWITKFGGKTVKAKKKAK